MTTLPSFCRTKQFNISTNPRIDLRLDPRGGPKRLSHNDRILERNPEPMLNNQGAGTGASDDIDRFFYEYHFTGPPYAQHVGRPGVRRRVVVNLQRPGGRARTWLFHRLRRILTARRATTTTTIVDGEDKAFYDHGYTGLGLRRDGDNGRELVDYLGREGGSHCAEVDLVIGARGPNFAVRSLLDPGAKRSYVGRRIWRGKVPESAVSSEFLKAFDARTPTRNLQGGGQVVGLVYTFPYIFAGRNLTKNLSHTQVYNARHEQRPRRRISPRELALAQ